MSRLLLDSVVALTQLLGAGTCAAMLRCSRQRRCNAGRPSFRLPQPGIPDLTNEQRYGSALWVLRPGTCTTRPRRTGAQEHDRGVADDPAERRSRGRCAPKRLNTLANGTTKPISEIEVGNRVLAEDPETGERGNREVTALWVHEDQVFYDYKAPDGTWHRWFSDGRIESK